MATDENLTNTSLNGIGGHHPPWSFGNGDYKFHGQVTFLYFHFLNVISLFCIFVLVFVGRCRWVGPECPPRTSDGRFQLNVRIECTVFALDHSVPNDAQIFCRNIRTTQVGRGDNQPELHVSRRIEGKERHKHFGKSQYLKHS